MDNNKKLILAAKGEIPIQRAVQEVMADYSRRIHDAIMPVSNITAPFALAVMMLYVEEIKKEDPEFETVAKHLTQQRPEVITIKTVVPREVVER